MGTYILHDLIQNKATSLLSRFMHMTEDMLKQPDEHSAYKATLSIQRFKTLHLV